MRLHTLNIVNLHGALNFRVDFKDEITLLVGINGCGKTSVLNVIDWLLKPNLQKLAITKYSVLALDFYVSEKKYHLKAEKTKKEVVLSIALDGVNKHEPIKITLDHNPDADADLLRGAYEGLVPEKHEKPMWRLLKSFVSPTVITLDRTITAETDETVYFETEREYLQHNARPKSSSRSPLTRVQDVTSEKFADYRSKAIQNDNELKARIVMSALQDPRATHESESFKKMTKPDIDQLENKVINYLSGAIKAENITKQVRDFFRTSRLLVERKDTDAMKSDVMLELVSLQYRQVDNLAKAFNDFENRNSAAFIKLSEYLNTINLFFGDSNKTLHFDESTGRLVFSFVTSDKKKSSEKKTINHLSSGEKQILILFTFLAFVAKEKSVFIVDEPELSLHPKWQHEFMDAFLQLRPKNTQLLLATHSPDIVGKYKDACVTIKGRENA